MARTGWVAMMSTLPEGMTAEKLRAVADWLDTYDRLAASFLANVEREGWESTEDLAEVLLTVSGKEVQDELRAWADEIDWSDNDRDVAVSAVYRLLDMVESGHFYSDYDESVETLGRAKDGFESLQQMLDRGAGWDAEDYPDEKEMQLRSLIAKIAPAVFVDSEGGGHDLGLWLDCGDITEDEYLIIQKALGR